MLSEYTKTERREQNLKEKQKRKCSPYLFKRKEVKENFFVKRVICFFIALFSLNFIEDIQSLD